MITTAQLATELGINQRAVQNRILRLGLQPERAGNAFVLTTCEADAVRAYGKPRQSYRQRDLCGGCRCLLTDVDRELGKCSQCGKKI